MNCEKHIKDIVVSYDFPPTIGGAHLWLYEVYRRWSAPVDVLTKAGRASNLANDISNLRSPDSRNPVVHMLELGNSDISLFSSDYWRSVVRTHRGIEEIANGQPVRLHCLRAFPEGIAGFMYTVRHPRKSSLVTFAHGEEILIARTSRLLKIMSRLVYRRSEKIIANSISTKKLVLDLQPRARVEVVHPGVDLSKFASGTCHNDTFRKEMGWNVGTIIVTTVGRMEPRKNQISVIRAIHQLRAENLDIAYVCAGTGESHDHLQATAEKLGLGKWVSFPGNVSDDEKYRILDCSDIFAMPSIIAQGLLEGFGIVFLEAAAAGIPSICGNSGGQPEAVIDGVTGVVTDGDNLTDVTNALRKLAMDDVARAAMEKNCRSWAADHDWSIVAKRIETLLENTVP